MRSEPRKGFRGSNRPAQVGVLIRAAQLEVWVADSISRSAVAGYSYMTKNA